MPYLVFAFWVIIANSLGVHLMYQDKQNAQSGGWRVKERDLFIVAAFFGALGIFVTMHVIRHKFRKYYFRYGMIVMLVANLVLGLIVVMLINLI